VPEDKKTYCGHEYVGEDIPPNRAFAERTLRDKAVAKVAHQIAAANDDDEQAGIFFVQIIQTIALLDQIAPQFIELVEEYHSKPFGPRENCHLCKLRAAAEEYLAGKAKTSE
jgi:hypothetical protein